MTDEEVLKIYQDAVDNMDLGKMIYKAFEPLFTDDYGIVPVSYDTTRTD